MSIQPAGASRPNDDATARMLGAVVQGLSYPSESDEPFDVVKWKATEADPLKQLAAMGKKTSPVTKQSLNEFFAELVSSEEGEKFKNLRKVLESALQGVQVLRVGEVEVDVYVIGKTATGNWMGVHTVSVET